MSHESRSARIGVVAVLLTVFALLAGVSASAGVKVANGNGAWEDPKTWLPLGVPGAGDDVIIGFGNTVTTDGTKKEVRSLGLQGTLVGKDGKDVHVSTTTAVTVSPGAVIEGGKGSAANPKGGDVLIDAGGYVENHGKIAGGGSINGRDGGGVEVVAGGDVRNKATGQIKGGRAGNAGDTSTKDGGTGGKVRVKGKNVDNDGTIRGGLGGIGIAGNIVNGHGGAGGDVTVGADDEVDNSKTIEGGDGNDAGWGPGSKAAGSGGNVNVGSKNKPTKNTGTIKGGDKGKPHLGGDGGRTGFIKIDGKKGVIVIGSAAVLHGSDVILQADDGSLVLSGLADRAIQADDGRVVLLSPGTLDLRGTSKGYQPRLAATRSVRVIANSILLDSGVELGSLASPSPDVRRRADFFAESTAKIGAPFGPVIYSPGDANQPYFCACSLSAATGVDLPGFGRMQIDLDHIFLISASSIYPFSRFSGYLDQWGQGMPRVDVPNLAQVVGIKLYVQAVMAVATASGWEFTNLTKFQQATISP